MRSQDEKRSIANDQPVRNSMRTGWAEPRQMDREVQSRACQRLFGNGLEYLVLSAGREQALIFKDGDQSAGQTRLYHGAGGRRRNIAFMLLHLRYEQVGCGIHLSEQLFVETAFKGPA